MSLRRILLLLGPLAWLSWGCDPRGAGPVATSLARPAAELPADTETAPGWAAPFERSDAAQRCLDLADSQAFAEAVAACSAALEEGPSAEVESALRDARSILGE